MNLLKETISDLRECGKTMQDVVWIGTTEVEIPVEVFERLADKEYDSSYGWAEVATDLLVCGDGWWLERHEYDGSEWWEFKETPHRPSRKVVPKRVMNSNNGWCTLKEMNHPGGKYKSVGVPFDWEGMEVQAV